jgi:hypothetical protein
MSDEISMVSRYLNPLRVLAGVGRRASALSALRAKESKYANAKVWLSRCAVPFKANVRLRLGAVSMVGEFGRGIEFTRRHPLGCD